MDKLYEFLREEFEKEIGIKTGWGKNEVMIAFDKAYIRAMHRYARLKGIPLD